MKNTKQLSDKHAAAEKTTPEEESLLTSLRAASWDEFHGQRKLKETLKIAITAAKKRKEPLEHVLLYGPPGLGKTTMAHLIGRELGVSVRVTSGPAMERAGDLASIITNLQPHDILFIDEIHRLNKVVEETIYPAMEDFALDIIIGKGPSARTLRLELPPFTIIGATTRIGLLSNPLRDRFGVVSRLAFYEPEELKHILSQAAVKLKTKIHESALTELSRRGRGTPRVALRLLKRVRDVAQVEGIGEITQAILDRSLSILEVDSMGLDSSDRRLLTTIIDKFAGGPVGIETIASALSEDIGTVEEVLEPYIMQIGFLKRTPRGRVVTIDGFKHLGKAIPKRLQESLF